MSEVLETPRNILPAFYVQLVEKNLALGRMVGL